MNGRCGISAVPHRPASPSSDKDSSRHRLLTEPRWCGETAAVNLSVIMHIRAQKMRTHPCSLLSFSSTILQGWEGETWAALQINIFHPNSLFKHNRRCSGFVFCLWWWWCGGEEAGVLHCFCWLESFICSLTGESRFLGSCVKYSPPTDPLQY